MRYCKTINRHSTCVSFSIVNVVATGHIPADSFVCANFPVKEEEEDEYEEQETKKKMGKRKCYVSVLILS